MDRCVGRNDPARPSRRGQGLPGPDTVAKLTRHGGTMLVVEAGSTLLIDKEQTIRDADAAGMVVLGRVS